MSMISGKGDLKEMQKLYEATATVVSKKVAAATVDGQELINLLKDNAITTINNFCREYDIEKTLKEYVRQLGGKAGQDQDVQLIIMSFASMFKKLAKGKQAAPAKEEAK